MMLAAMAVPLALTAACASATNPGATNPGATNPGATNPGATSPGAASPGTASTSAASASGVSAHSAAAIPARSTPTASFSAMGLSFRYPATWRSVTPRSRVSDFPALIVYLSTSRLSGTCVASIRPGRTAETCSSPIRVLPPGGVLVSWNANDLPNRRMPKATTTVAGRAAVESKARAGWCAVLGGTETITVMIPRALPGTWYQMDACLRGPGLPGQEAQISAMLNSVRISPGS